MLNAWYRSASLTFDLICPFVGYSIGMCKFPNFFKPDEVLDRGGFDSSIGGSLTGELAAIGDEWLGWELDRYKVCDEKLPSVI